MSLENIWAPWRLGYIKGDRRLPKASSGQLDLLPGADPECFICCAIADSADRDNLVVRRGERSVVLLNRYPYNNGHLLVSPLVHKAGLSDLEADEQAELQQVITQVTSLLAERINADGFNVGLNLGSAAGAGVPGHLHWHIVPRWQGDTNFMPTVAGIKVIPQSLDAMWEFLSAALD